MKKNTLLITAISVSVALASCAGGGETASEETPATTEETVETITWTLDPAASNIRWEGGTAGAKVYSHFGNIAVQEGMVVTEGGSLVSGKFAIDMTTINPQDENYSEEHPASDLVGHLASDDFFSIETYPTATFVVKSAEGNTVTGDLTIKGKTNEETINVESMNIAEDGMTATGTLVFDRQKYDVAWAHYLKDVVLSDDITLNITLAAKKG